MNQMYLEVPEFSDARKICCNLDVLKINTKRPNLRVFRQKDVNGKAKSEDHGSALFAHTCLSENLGALR